MNMNLKSLTRKFLTAFTVFTLISCSKDDDSSVIISNDSEIITFKINDVEGTITGTDIAITLPHGTAPNNLSAVATISENASIDPNPATNADYSVPKEFTVTSEDGTTQKTYTITVTIATIVPSAENPYPEGVFVLREVQGQLRELDFRHTSGSMSTKVFQNANNGRKIEGFSITDIIPHEKGYLIFLNMDDQSLSKLYFTDLKLTIKKEIEIEKANVVSHRYARIGNKIYYTNVSDINEVNQPENKSYIIDTEAETLTKVDKQYKQFFADNTGQLYCTSIANGFNRVTDLNTLDGTRLADFNQHSNSFVLDQNNVLWSTYHSRTPETFAEVIEFSRGIFNYKLKLVQYNINNNVTRESTSTEDINRNSNLFTYNNKIYIITNQNKHIADAKKELQEMYVENNEVKLRSVHNLPKKQGPQHIVLNDVDIFNFTGNTMMIFGNGNTEGNGNYYYDLDMASGTTTDRILNAKRLFHRKAL